MDATLTEVISLLTTAANNATTGLLPYNANFLALEYTPDSLENAYPRLWFWPSGEGGEYEAFELGNPATFRTTHNIDCILAIGQRGDASGIDAMEQEYRLWERRWLVFTMRNYTLGGRVFEIIPQRYKPFTPVLNDGPHIGLRFTLTVVTQVSVTKSG